MKRIEAVVPQRSGETISLELMKAGVSGVTIYDSRGIGETERSVVISGRGTGRYRAAFNANSTIVIVTKDSMVNSIVEKIQQHSSTDQAGEGKIFVSDVSDAIDIGSQRRGESVVSK